MRAGGLGCRRAGDELIEGFIAVVTDVFVNRHEKGNIKYTQQKSKSKEIRIR